MSLNLSFFLYSYIIWLGKLSKPQGSQGLMGGDWKENQAKAADGGRQEVVRHMVCGCHGVTRGEGPSLEVLASPCRPLW